MDISKEAARRVLEGDASLGAAFVWADTAQGHKFWERQADEGLTAEGRAILERIAYGDKPKFAVGDRVRVVNNKDNGGRNIAEYRVGEVHTITGTCRGTKGDAWLLNNHYQYLNSDQIEPVSAAPQPQLTIRAGAYYKTRDGRKVGPVVQRDADRIGDADGPYRIAGEWNYLESGLVGSISKGDHPADLIAEWVDEPVVARFKVGDRVRVIGDPWGEGHEGRAATIESIVECYSPAAFTAVVDGTDGFDWFFESEQLAPFTPAQCIVALIENGQPRPSANPFVHPDREAATKEARRLAGKHKGQEFGVYELVSSERQDKVYEHEWQWLAAGGETYHARKELQRTGITGIQASRIVQEFVAAA